MGHFIDGEWHSGYYGADSQGRFLRPPTTYRAHIESSDIEENGLHLYVSYACPWAHRTLIARARLGLERFVSVSVVDWLTDDDSWRFFPEHPGATPDHLFGHRLLREVYLEADAKYSGRVTVPVLWSRPRQTIVNNESREILRHFSTTLAQAAGSSIDLSPESLRPHIDATIDAIYNPINNGVYRCGFAQSQQAYDEAVEALYAALDEWEVHLAKQPFLCGDRFTEADICLFTTLVRFDPVYSVHFKCSIRRILDYPHLSAYLRSIYQLPGVAETCNFEHIRNHYYQSHAHINPTRIVARAPVYDLHQAHDRFSGEPFWRRS